MPKLNDSSEAAERRRAYARLGLGLLVLSTLLLFASAYLPSPVTVPGKPIFFAGLMLGIAGFAIRVVGRLRR
ncbi:MAG: hypothetical protein AAFY46_14530 [Planctomycetota bacterium]